MKRQHRSAIGAGIASAMFLLTSISASGQTPARALPRTTDGKPHFNGIWQSVNTATWDLEDHTEALGTPPGQGVVEGGSIPYRPEAAKKKQDNFTHRAT